MQANIQTQFLNYLDFQKIKEFPDCQYQQAGKSHSNPERDIYSPNYKFSDNFGKIDEDIEATVDSSILNTKSGNGYGASYSALYQFSGYPELFNKKNCQKYDPKLLRQTTR
jgi:hypothetical protein